MMVLMIRSVLDYAIQIRMLPDKNKNYMALTGNYSVAGFELTLRRKVISEIAVNEGWRLKVSSVDDANNQKPVARLLPLVSGVKLSTF